MFYRWLAVLFQIEKKKVCTCMFTVSDSYASNQPINEQEVWETCAMKLSLKESLTWPPFQKGFSMALWVCLSEGQSNRFCPNMPLYNLETGKLFYSWVLQEIWNIRSHMRVMQKVLSL